MTATCHREAHTVYCDALAGELDGFLAVVRGADPAAAVPTCPAWTVADLADHLGGVHRWAAQMVAAGSQERLRRGKTNFGAPDDPTRLGPWLEEGASRLLAALGNADPDAPMWAWGSDKHVRFWSRRMVHETAVHRVDALLAVGAEPSVPAAQATDGIDELLDNLPCAAYFAAGVKELLGDGHTLAFDATDTGVRWSVVLGDDGFRWDHEHRAAAAELRAPAADLLLVLYGRLPPDAPSVTVAGDAELVRHWLAHSSL